MKPGARIRQRREALGITQTALADCVGISKQNLYKYENGIITNIPSDRMEAIAAALNTTPAALMGWSEVPLPSNAEPVEPGSFVSFPVIGSIAAGYDCEAVEEYTSDIVTVPRQSLRGQSRDAYFALRVKGDSMFPRLEDGDTILVRRCAAVDPGAIAVVLYNGDEATVKKVYMGEGWIDLIPINPEYPTRRIEGEALAHCRILGQAVTLLRDF